MKRFKFDMEAGKDKVDGHYVYILDTHAMVRVCKVFGSDAKDVDMKAKRLIDLLNANAGKPHSNPHNTAWNK